MHHTSTEISRIVLLADQIEVDIAQRGLKHGDRYLRTDETAKLFAVDAKVANRALQLLVKRKRMTRRPGLGTIVLDPAASEAASIERVHLVAGNRRKAIQVMVDSGELFGLQEELPGASIQLDAVARTEEPAYLEGLIKNALKADMNTVFVLHASTIEMQRTFAASGLPTVVQGSVYPSIQGLPSINSDHHRAGTLAAEHVLGKGHRRILILARQWQSPRGDGILINAIYRAAHARGLTIDALDLRFVPEDAAVGAAVASEIFDSSTDLPAIIAFSRVVADAVRECIEARGLQAGRDVALVTLDFPILQGDLPDYPYVERALSSLEYGAALGRLLKQLVLNGADDTPDTLVPVRLWTPAGGTAV